MATDKKEDQIEAIEPKKASIPSSDKSQSLNPVDGNPTEIQGKDAQVSGKEEPVNLGTSKPVDATPPQESARQYGKKVTDLKNVAIEAGKKGIDINNLQKTEPTGSNQDNLLEAVKGAYAKDLATRVDSLGKAYSPPPITPVPKLDLKDMMESEKKQRRARFGDALYAFGEGLQGKVANPETFASNRIQRKQDEVFQNYKDVTERNANARYLYDNQTRDKWIDWLNEQQKDERLDADTKAKYQQMADQLKQNADFKQQQLDIAKERNRILASKKPKIDKEDKPVIIQTANKRYEIDRPTAEMYKGEILKNAETLSKKYPGWFTENQTQRTDENTGKTIYGPKTYRLNDNVKDNDMIRAYLENKENPDYSKFEDSKNNLQKIYEQRGDIKPNSFDKYRNTPATATQSPTPAQPKQAAKADPLGLR